jgi:hypothetical protein
MQQCDADAAAQCGTEGEAEDGGGQQPNIDGDYDTAGEGQRPCRLRPTGVNRG